MSTSSPPFSHQDKDSAAAALLFQLESGLDMPLSDTLIDTSLVPSTQKSPKTEGSPSPAFAPEQPENTAQNYLSENVAPFIPAPPPILSPAAGTLPADSAKVRDMANAASSIDALRATLLAFDGHPLKRHATNMVFADGSPDARVMLIGEAPGADEDISGLPFVGAAGQLLDKMLAAIHLDRKSQDVSQGVYITNVVHYRPPGNRTPTDQEIELSLPFTQRHIALHRPKLLILSGGVAAKAILNTREGITRLRGQWTTYTPKDADGSAMDPIPVMPIYHPSFLLRTPHKKREAWDDLQLIAARLKELG